MVDYEPHSYYNFPSLNVSMSQFVFSFFTAGFRCCRPAAAIVVYQTSIFYSLIVDSSLFCHMILADLPAPSSQYFMSYKKPVNADIHKLSVVAIDHQKLIT